MPIFDFKCKQCNATKDDVYLHKYDDKVKCVRCGGDMAKLFNMKYTAKCFPAEGVFLENVGPDGRTFHSKKEMLDFEKANDMNIWAAH